MNAKCLMLRFLFVLLLLLKPVAVADEVFFIEFNEGPLLHEIIRATDGSKTPLTYSKLSNVKAANDLDALDVSIKWANDHGQSNRFVLIGHFDNARSFVLKEWYIICPFLDGRPSSEKHDAPSVWKELLDDKDFATIVQSPVDPKLELKRDYLIKTGEYCRVLESPSKPEKGPH